MISSTYMALVDAFRSSTDVAISQIGWLEYHGFDRDHLLRAHDTQKQIVWPESRYPIIGDHCPNLASDGRDDATEQLRKHKSTAEKLEDRLSRTHHFACNWFMACCVQQRVQGGKAQEGHGGASS